MTMKLVISESVNDTSISLKFIAIPNFDANYVLMTRMIRINHARGIIPIPLQCFCYTPKSDGTTHPHKLRLLDYFITNVYEL
jgi:hypothetical protein